DLTKTPEKPSGEDVEPNVLTSGSNKGIEDSEIQGQGKNDQGDDDVTFAKFLQDKNAFTQQEIS
ncbi:hypothetical protein A2U01_0043096, partial [Trifolium medium]|nr:hypothetical protein [Trifolium medium]